MEHRAPLVSVVLPSRDRSQLLRKALVEGLYLQDYPSECWEIIVIDDGSVDDTSQVIEELTPLSPVPLRSYQLEGTGAAVARNYGSFKARGEIVAHIDDDGRAVPQWLSAAAAPFADPKVAIVTGPIVPEPDQTTTFFSFRSESYEDRGMYPTSNIFYRRETFVEEGGFSENFGVNLLGRPAYGWDTDLAWRIRRRGYRAVFAEEAVTYSHIFRLSPMQWIQEPWKAHLLPNVIRHAPESTRGIFPAYPFLNSVHVYWFLSFLGLILGSRFRPAGLLHLPWILRIGGTLPYDLKRPWRWPFVIIKMSLLWIQQVVLFVSLVYGGIRARKVVL